MSIADFIRKKKKQLLVKFLTTSNPDKIVEEGEKKLIKSFRRAALNVPAYRKILEEKKVDIDKVKDIASFRKLVPIIDKEATFVRFPLEELCIDGYKDVEFIMLSSGHSKKFSFNVVTEDDRKMTKKKVDLLLDLFCNTSEKKTFLINFEPMAVRVETSLLFAETSVRSDSVIALVKQMKDVVDQFIIAGDSSFLKKIVEDGIENGIDWKSLNVWVITGGYWFSESFREYIMDLMGMDFSNPSKGLYLATYGVTELGGIGLFLETFETARIRNIAQKDEKLRYALFKEDVDACPFIFQYFPNKIFLESLPSNSLYSELVFSMLDTKMKMPLIRYNTNDCGKIFRYEEFKDVLIKAGYKYLIPKYKLPVVCVGGRKKDIISIGKRKISPSDIKEAVYRYHDVASSISGNFIIDTRNGIKVEFQLKRGKRKTKALVKKIKNAIKELKGFSLPVRLHEFYEFLHQMEIDYERKFRHVI